MGLEYYKELFRDEIFWICLKNNALYALVSLIGQVFFGLIIAAVLESKCLGSIRDFFVPLISFRL